MSPLMYPSIDNTSEWKAKKISSSKVYLKVIKRSILFIWETSFISTFRRTTTFLLVHTSKVVSGAWACTGSSQGIQPVLKEHAQFKIRSMPVQACIVCFFSWQLLSLTHITVPALGSSSVLSAHVFPQTNCACHFLPKGWGGGGVCLKNYSSLKWSWHQANWERQPYISA